MKNVLFFTATGMESANPAPVGRKVGWVFVRQNKRHINKKRMLQSTEIMCLVKKRGTVLSRCLLG